MQAESEKLREQREADKAHMDSIYPCKKGIKKRTHLFQMDSFFHDSIEFYSSANSSSFLWIISSIFSIYNATSLIFSHRSIR